MNALFSIISDEIKKLSSNIDLAYGNSTKVFSDNSGYKCLFEIVGTLWVKKFACNSFISLDISK